MKITVNKQFADADTPVKGGDEIAFVAFSMA
jgi:molybdopterin converting factor small subunit